MRHITLKILMAAAALCLAACSGMHTPTADHPDGTFASPSRGSFAG